jgi:class 3 adenylate cyclase/pimeloyl-ACP methyl ester carboxylesterase
VVLVGDIPETQYVRTASGAHLAYQVSGDGPLDLILPQVGSHVDLAWEMPTYARVYRRLASFSRLIRFDQRGSGLSDPLGFSELPSFEQFALDMLAVLDAAGSERAAVLGNETAGLGAMFFAATYPNRTSALVLDGCFARLARAADYPFGIPPEVLARAVERVQGGAGSALDTGIGATAPHASKDPQFLAQWQRYIRSVHGPTAQRASAEMLVYADVRPLLPAVQAPTLVLYRAGDRFTGKPHAVYLAEHIGGAKLVEVPGDDTLLFVPGCDADLDEIEEFLTGVRPAPETQRVLATVLFTDIVGSTERAARLGDRAWRELLDAHDGVVRRQLDRFRGREVNTVGDGFVATFDGPGRAIECACAIRDALTSLEIDLRTGLHTGEIEMRGGDVAGIAVHLAQRVSALAAPREVLVSRTVTDYVVGSGIQFEDRGEHDLKGVPGTWRLYSVAR